MSKRAKRQALGLLGASLLLVGCRGETTSPEISSKVHALISVSGSVIDQNQPSDPWMKGVADIDGKSELDLIVCGRGGPLVYYEAPSWTKRTISTNIGSSGSSTGLNTGDIDNDGDQDVVLANGYWYENPRPGGDPAAGTWTRHQVGSANGHDVFLNDLDGDGDLDLIKRHQGGPGNKIYLWRQDTLPNWTNRTLTVPSGEGLVVADVDSDGDADLVIAQYWYENTKDVVNGAWTQHTYSTTYTHPDVVVQVGKINNDNYPDIVLTPAESSGGNYRISWFEGPATPKSSSFTEHTVKSGVETVYHSLQLADMDKDNQLDIVTAEMHQGSNPDQVLVFLNDGNGASFTEQELATTGSHSVQVADFDGDGDIDIFGANWDDSAPDNAVVRMWTNTTAPSKLPLNQWQRHVVDAARPHQAVFIAAGDLNGDAKKDIVTGGWWYQNAGGASCGWTRHTLGSPLNNMAAVSDFDNDGDLDVLGTEGQGSSSNDAFVWARNNGSGTFSILSNIDDGDGDFLQGVATLPAGASTPQSVALSWHQGNKGVQLLSVPGSPASATWTWQQLSPTSQDEQLSAGDIDKDGDTDLLLGTKWLRDNRPGGSGWSVFTLNPTGGNPDRNRLADINDDGKLDAVVGFEAISVSGKLAWYEQPSSATGTWTEHVIDQVVGPMSLDVADMDGDGDLDVVVGEHNLSSPSSARVFVYENTDGKGGAWMQHLVHQGDEHHDGTQVVDIEGDGDMDIISIGWGHDNVLLYENQAINQGTGCAACTVDGDCNDSDDCTDDSCVNQVCQNLPVFGCCKTHGDCSDGNDCTDDMCINLTCSSTPKANCCTDASQCNDGQICTDDTCVNNVCQFPPKSNCCTGPGDCDDSDDCTSDSCVANVCQFAAISGCCAVKEDCTDASVCTDESCVNQVCQFTPVPGCCQSQADCDDGNNCTTDTCDTASGNCTNAPQSGCCAFDTDCDDNDSCTENKCISNSCQYPPLVGCCKTQGDCDDGSPCTTETCVNESCQYVAVPDCCTDKDQCADNDQCTTDVCNANKCQNVMVSGCCVYDTDCDDTNDCSADACQNNVCQFTAISGCCSSDADCMDNNSCTTDTCDTSSGICSNDKAAGCCIVDTDCDDGNACTLDSCDAASNKCGFTAIVGCEQDGGATGDGGGRSGDGGVGGDAAEALTGGCGCAVDGAASGEMAGTASWLLLALGFCFTHRRRRRRAIATARLRRQAIA